MPSTPTVLWRLRMYCGSPAYCGPASDLCRARERAVDHGNRIRGAVSRDEGTEARAFLLAEQHLIEHVEPVERDAGLAVLGLFLVVEKRFAPADFIDNVLD